MPIHPAQTAVIAGPFMGEDSVPVMHAVQIFLFDALHHSGAMGEIGFQGIACPGRHHHYLIAGHLSPGDWPHVRNQANTPLKNERQVPDDQQADGKRGGGDGIPRAAEPPADFLDENRQPHDKQRGE